jgi:hypothetical protein
MPRVPATFITAWLLSALALSEAPAHAQVEQRWRAYSNEMAEPWLDIQRDTGNLPDYLDGLNNPFQGTRYGDAMMGWGLLQVGVRERHQRTINAALDAIDYATSDDRNWGRPSVFETMAIASAYNIARRRIPDDPRFRRLRTQWEKWLKRVRTVRLQYVNKYGNHWLVDAISVLELQRSGLRSRARGAVIGSGRTRARRQAIRLINIRVPRLVRGRGPLVLSDPPDQPIAYHGLSIAFYARAIRLMGRRAKPAARTALRRAIRASRLLTSPDGDVSYFGRSQEEIWTLPATAYAGQLASLLPGTSRKLRSQSEALAERTLQRLRREYAVGPQGSWVTPALAQNLRAGSRALDAYAGAPAYVGLALVWLNLTINEHPADPPPGDLPADRLLATSASTRSGRFSVVRRSRLWFAVKKNRSIDPHFTDDLRYDFGLAIAKRRQPDGSWRDLVPERPRTDRSVGSHASAGPVLTDGGRALPFGDRISTTRKGVVRIAGGFRTPGGSVLRRLVFVYRPAACGGVRLTWAGRVGEAYEMSAFFRGRNAPIIDGATATAGGQQVTVDPRPNFGRATDGGASGVDPRLVRQRFTIRVPVNRQVRVTFCPPRRAGS